MSLRRRFARGINKTIRGLGTKGKKIGGKIKKGLDKIEDPTNPIAGTELAGVGGALSRQAKEEKKMRKYAVSFSIPEFEDICEFAMGPGIDPNIVQNLVEQASRIQQEGQTKIIISRQLFEQLQAALQNFQVQKQQIDQQSVSRIKQMGFQAGHDLIYLDKGPCWEGYEAIGMKMKNGRKVPNCVKKKNKKMRKAVR